MVDSILCPVCSSIVETVEHIFANCSDLIALLSRIAIWWGVNCPSQLTVDSLFNWADSTTWKICQHKAFDAVILTTFWCIWNFRNNVIFRAKTPKKSLIFDDVVHKSYVWISSRCSKANISWSSWLHSPFTATKLK
ncbi:uncharacterized protein LOC111876074 [Lactuca sativa]|uniref:uncharacterized protein LOC111876074 n=1 Tax=Lactuca sativa TaxID=4236 RepID=UPI000CD96BCB|nr:uncharacterized protein LOC111876074 [Lactuca sativa]